MWTSGLPISPLCSYHPQAGDRTWVSKSACLLSWTSFLKIPSSSPPFPSAETATSCAWLQHHPFQEVLLIPQASPDPSISLPSSPQDCEHMEATHSPLTLYLQRLAHKNKRTSVLALTDWPPHLPSPGDTKLLKGRNCLTQLPVHPVCAALSLVHRCLPSREACVQVIKEIWRITGRESSSY